MRIYLPLLPLPGARGHPSDGIQPGKNVIFILVRGIPFGGLGSEVSYQIDSSLSPSYCSINKDYGLP